MATETLKGLPGFGGSLGECALCGVCFIVELVMGSKVQRIVVEGVTNADTGKPADLAIHLRCMDALETAKRDGWETLPEGPLRRLYATAADERGA